MFQHEFYFMRKSKYIVFHICIGNDIFNGARSYRSWFYKVLSLSAELNFKRSRTAANVPRRLEYKPSSAISVLSNQGRSISYFQLATEFLSGYCSQHRGYTFKY